METICLFLLGLAEVDRFKVYGAFALVAFAALMVLLFFLAREDWRFFTTGCGRDNWWELPPWLKRACFALVAYSILVLAGFLASEAFFFS